ncbi:ATP-dependent endonuclease [Ramlibacter sp. WS9]|uniref:ATP-dependent nuclease n=1 Tax=Ramlibacter sp. WS9 TaxID=1882741 RepID=UPI00130521DA|nr:AAA family ATPase [Ramlibacter sp. WS9]
MTIDMELPLPWTKGRFLTSKVGAINYLVGANGSGKSRFASVLRTQLPKVRLLSTDRLAGMEGEGGLRTVVGDHFPDGFAKSKFDRYRNAGLAVGSGIDTLMLLEQRLDLRIQVEATLGHIFNRRINLEWVSGNLVANATLGATGAAYRIDREECHGIKELLVLLTHLYDDEHDSIIIDEPELNLHPQYQAFFMQEVRRVAGNPKVDRTKKVVFLITHSPFILDFRSIDDVRSVISFDLKHEAPRHIFEMSEYEAARLKSIVPRLNVHHKQLFFSDNPIFVEGIIDAQIVEAVQEARGISTAAAGSCVIDAGGCEEVNQYFTLCTAFAKKAYFLYDLDSLFSGNLRACVKGSDSVQSFLAAAGVGGNFAKYCGELDSRLTAVIDTFLASTNTPNSLADLRSFLTEFGPRPQWAQDRYPRARAAMMSAIGRVRADIILATSESVVADVEGRLRQICHALKEKNILLLPGGPLERYLPSFSGHPYKLSNDAKNATLPIELAALASGMTDLDLRQRYGELFDLIALLPGKTAVDMESVLREYLSSYVHDLQGAILTNSTWELEELCTFMKRKQATTLKTFSLASLSREAGGKFRCVVAVSPLAGQSRRHVVVTETTNAGMRSFPIEAESA